MCVCVCVCSEEYESFVLDAKKIKLSKTGSTTKILYIFMCRFEVKGPETLSIKKINFASANNVSAVVMQGSI